MGSYGGYLLETAVTLVVVSTLAFVILYGARRLGVGRPRGPIELVGQLPLDARRAIYLIQVGEQVLVVGASEAGFTKLGEVSSRELPVAETVRGASFREVLARVVGDGRRSIDRGVGTSHPAPNVPNKPPARDLEAAGSDPCSLEREVHDVR